MEITVSANLSSKIPEFKVGVITYENIEVGPSPQMVKGRLQLFQEALFFDLEEKELTDFSGIKVWRKFSRLQEQTRHGIVPPWKPYTAA